MKLRNERYREKQRLRRLKKQQSQESDHKTRLLTAGELSVDDSRRLLRDRVLKGESRGRSISLITTIVTCVAVLTFVTATIAAAVYVPQVAIYVPIIAIALALALQKYTASFFAFFVITFSKIYDLGDRIRIGNIKGDVRHIGLLHTTLEEVGEDEKLGGELTGRLLYVPNLIILDQSVLNYSKDYSAGFEPIYSDYMFDEVRIPLTTDSNVEKACKLLEDILKKQDEIHVAEAEKMFQNDYPKFLDEALSGPRVLVFVEPKQIWIKGKFVTPLKGRNELRSQILLQFMKEIADMPDIKLA